MAQWAQIAKTVSKVLNSISAQALNMLGVKDCTATAIDVDAWAGRLKWPIGKFTSSKVAGSLSSSLLNSRVALYKSVQVMKDRRSVKYRYRKSIDVKSQPFSIPRSVCE